MEKYRNNPKIMIDLFRQVYNALYHSSHRFGDGSGLYYMIRYDIIRYYSGDNPCRIADIPTVYNQSTRLSRIDLEATWRWRDAQVPLGDWSESGPVLSETEKVNLLNKLRVFIAKQPRHFEPLG